MSKSGKCLAPTSVKNECHAANGDECMNAFCDYRDPPTSDGSHERKLLPENEWAERAADEISVRMLPAVYSDATTLRCKGQTVEIILHHSATEFAVLEKALEMAILESKYRIDCPYESCGDKYTEFNKDCIKCVMAYFKAKAREEVGND